MSVEAGEAFIHVGGRKRRATPAEVQRVRELECQRNGHSYEAVMVVQSSDPQRFLCDWCGKAWRVVPENQPGEVPELPGCPACGSSQVDHQTPDEGSPFSCNNCGLEFFEGTGCVHLPSLLSDQLNISRSEARRIINQGGVKLDGEAVEDLDPPAQSISGKTLKVGKQREVRVP